MLTPLDKQRAEYIKLSLEGFSTIEDKFYKKTNKTCREIKIDYKKSCMKAMTLSKIRDFYDDGFYKKYSNMIIKELRFKELKKVMETLLHFKNILLIREDIDTIPLKIQKDVLECIRKRIEYKHKCIDPEDRDSVHDTEILRYIFYSEKFDELLKLFKLLRMQYKLAVKQYQQDTIDFKSIRDMNMSETSSESGGEPFEAVLKKKITRTSRQKISKKKK